MELFNKFKDKTFGNAKAVYEKSCDDFTFRYLSDLDSPISVKGKFIDKDNHLIQFSEDIFPKKIKFTNDLFFTDRRGVCYVIEQSSVKTEDLQIELSTTTEKHTVTNATFTPKTLALQ